MSATLTETFESLHITAARKLMELLETQKDPNLLARLIATALRYKLPKPARAADETPSPPRNNAPSTNPAKASADPQPAPSPYTDEEYGNLVVRYGEDRAAEMNDRREAIIANLTSRVHAHTATG